MISYNYETLGDERFQQLCQALLTTIHQDVQCLPTGQPDGGRDAFLRRSMAPSGPKLTVFQVKYSKNPTSKESRQVVEDLIGSEEHKVKRLIGEGLERYYLITNVNGTSHHETGSIDRINKRLTDTFGIEASCWWRDDIDRRLDANNSIKWSYPEILKGTDVLQRLYEGCLGQDASRRMSAVYAYLAHQYKYDSQLKFKQVDLERGIVDLFVDVPAVVLGPTDRQERGHWPNWALSNPIFAALVSDNARQFAGAVDEQRVGAVEALANSTVAKALPRVVIEGAPGQGKSTVTQFLCQLHRMVLLDKRDEAVRVADELRPTEVRLPMRVDLRDYATWLSGNAPARDPISDGSKADKQSLSLESFLATQISLQSGGMNFSPDDLLAVARNSSLLIVLDGFDEVADTALRNRLVREISDASTRLEGNSISFQIIVTSRPAAFANSPGFPRDEWQHIQILPLTRPVIFSYTEKWISGHSMDKREGEQIGEVLEEKLEYAHVRDLARNPMQLAILLALISTQGASLPDKRTTLYDRYVDILLNRESEKSRIVRDKRELLVEMHGFLAWKLQKEVEKDAKAGNIAEVALRKLLRDYLENRGHDTSLITGLFNGMVERVVALVSRVQGTFEFEVQPLREYFAARYLYNTAPYIQAGSRRSGSIMDRFEGLAQNAYWLNVTRFYCGCYSSGQLASLVDCLISIGDQEKYDGSAYVEELALTLLGDYVFSQEPRSVTRLMDFILEPGRFRVLLARRFVMSRHEPLALPEDCGRRRLLSSAIEGVKQASAIDMQLAFASVIGANVEYKRAVEIWYEIKSSLSLEKAWRFSVNLGVVDTLPVDELLSLVRDIGREAVQMCFYRCRIDVFDEEPELWSLLVDFEIDELAGLYAFYRPDEKVPGSAERSVRTLFQAINALAALDPAVQHQGTIADVVGRYRGRLRDGEIDAAAGATIGQAKLPVDADLLEAAHRVLEVSVVNDAEIEAAANQFFDLLVRAYGYRASIIDAAIGALDRLDRDAVKLRAEGLLKSLSEVKANAQKSEWWRDAAVDHLDAERALLLVKAYLAWVGDRHLLRAGGDISRVLEQLPKRYFHSVWSSERRKEGPYSKLRSAATAGKDVDFDWNDAGRVCARFVALVAPRLPENALRRAFYDVLVPYDGDDPCILQARFDAAWHLAHSGKQGWPDALAVIAETCEAEFRATMLMPLPSHDAVPLEVAKAICKKPASFPLAVTQVAEGVVTESIGAMAVPVSAIAESQGWFADA